MDRKRIPFTENFFVNTNGEVFDANGVKRNIYRNGDGYKTACVKTTDGRWVTFGVHRLVGLTHLPERKPEQTELNHRDTDIENAHVSNLEWVTPSQNNIHSEIMRVDNYYTTLYSVRDGVPLQTYNNAHEAAQIHGCKALDVWDCVKNDSDINGIKFYFRRCDKGIPPSLRHDRKTNFKPDTRQPPKAIKMLDIETGDIIEFESLLEAAKYFNTYASHIFQSISKNSYPRVFRKRYQVEYIDNDFPVMSLEELDRARTHGKRKVVAYNVKDNSCAIFESAKSFIEFSKLSKKAVTTSLVKNQLRQIGDWVAVYESPENLENLKSYIAGSAVV